MVSLFFTRNGCEDPIASLESRNEGTEPQEAGAAGDLYVTIRHSTRLRKGISSSGNMGIQYLD